ncbi:MAG: hypothetical protein ACFFAN_14370 [Promethearchaeota archaeon]
MTLDPIEFLNGIFSLILVAQSIYVGLLIASKYKKHKDRYLILLGINTILLFEPWWPSSVSFLVVLITNEGLNLQMYLLIGNFLTPVALLIWLTIFTHFLYQDHQMKILIIASIISVLYEIAFFYYLFTDPDSLGVLKGFVDIEYKSFVLGFLTGCMLVLLVTGILLARASISFENPELKLKGKLMLIGFISFVVGAALDTAIPLNPYTLPITRIIIITSALELYGGFILPEWMKKLFLKDESP